MPLEVPLFIDTLVPEWPTGGDPRSNGDDHIRIVKQVLQNTFPGLNAAISAGSQQINDLTSHFGYVVGDGGLNPDRMEPHNADWTAAIALTSSTPTLAQYQNNSALVLTYRTLADMWMPVGHVLTTKRVGNPVDWLGFGTWVPHAGYLAGAGEMADSAGFAATIPLGHDAGFWRIQTNQIIYTELQLQNGSAAEAGHHDHASYIQASDQEGYAGIQGTSSAPDGEVRTGGGGSHSHTVTGVTVIGQGAPNEAGLAYFRNPTQGVYVWERTA